FLSFTSVNSASTTLPSSVFFEPLGSAPVSAPACCCCCCASAYIFSPSFCEACASACALASILSLSSVLSASSASLIAASIFVFSSAPILSPYSLSDLRTECTSASSWLRAVTSSSCFLSSAACASAS